MKRFSKLLAPVSLVSVFALSALTALHITAATHQAQICVLPQVDGAHADQKTSTDERVYYVGCGGLF